MKVALDQMRAILLHQFDGWFILIAWRLNEAQWKLSILRGGVNEAALFGGCGKLGWVNMKQARPHPNGESCFWSRDSHSPASIWCLVHRGKDWLKLKETFSSQGRGQWSCSLRWLWQAWLGQHETGTAPPKPQKSFWSEDSHSSESIWWLVHRGKDWLKLNEVVGSLWMKGSMKVLSLVVGENSVGSTWNRRAQPMLWKLFLTNGSHSPASIWWLIHAHHHEDWLKLKEIVHSQGSNRMSWSLWWMRQPQLWQHGECNPQPKWWKLLLMEWRLVSCVNLMVGSFFWSLTETQQNCQFSGKRQMKLLSLVVAASSTGSMWRWQCPTQIMKVHFEQRAAILLHQLAGWFILITWRLIGTQGSCRFQGWKLMNLLSLMVAASLVGFLGKGSMKLLTLVVGTSLIGSTWRTPCQTQTLKVALDWMRAILLHQFDGSFSWVNDWLKLNQIVDSHQRGQGSCFLWLWHQARSGQRTRRRECPAEPASVSKQFILMKIDWLKLNQIFDVQHGEANAWPKPHKSFLIERDFQFSNPRPCPSSSPSEWVQNDNDLALPFWF
jgi:hypothetical protein